RTRPNHSAAQPGAGTARQAEAHRQRPKPGQHHSAARPGPALPDKPPASICGSGQRWLVWFLVRPAGPKDQRVTVGAFADSRLVGQHLRGARVDDQRAGDVPGRGCWVAPVFILATHWVAWNGSPAPAFGNLDADTGAAEFVSRRADARDAGHVRECTVGGRATSRW